MVRKPIIRFVAGLLVVFLFTHAQAQEKSKLTSLDRTINRMHLAVGNLSEAELNRAIQKNEALLAKYPNSQFTPNILFQLSELYIKKARLEYGRRMAFYDQALKKYDKGLLATEPQMPRIDFGQALDYLQDLEKDYPYISFIDKVLYRMALCYQEENNQVKSREYFAKLVEQFPQSPLVAESFFRLGEQAFDQGNYEKAIQFYSHLVTKKMWDNSFYDMSLYKLAWSYYKLNKYPDAISTFMFLLKDIDVQQRLKTQYLDRSSTDLRDEALQYIAISFSEFGGPEKARDFLLALGKNKYDDEILRRLGNIYRKQDRLELAIETYKILLKVDPRVSYAPDVQMDIVSCYKQLWDLKKANEAREQLVTNYGLESNWYRGIADDSLRTHVKKIVRDALYNIGVYHQLHARELGHDLDEYRAAIKWHRKFLEDFPEDPAAYKVRYFLAECHYQVGDYEAAAEYYKKVAYDTSSTDYLEDAAYNVILSYLKASENAKGTKPVVFEVPRFLTIKDTVRIEVANADLENFVLSSLEFPQLVKNSKRSVEVLLKLADELSKIQRFDLARAAYLTVINEYPESPYAGRAMMLVAQSYFKEEDYANAEKWYKTVVSSIPDSTGLVEKAKAMMASSHYKLAEKLVSEGKEMEAAKEYAHAAIRYPNSQIAQMALVQAAKQFEAIGDTTSAAQIYESFLAKYPDSKMVDQVAVAAATYREKMKQWPKAAADYLKLVAINSPLKARALFFAAKDYYRAQNLDKALDLYAKYTTIFDNYNRYEEALCRLGEGYYQKSNPDLALTFLQKALQVYKQNPKENISPYFPAQASFLIGEIHFDRFQNIKITENFAQSLTAKKKALTICLRDYKRTIDFRVAEWVTASYYKIGRAWEVLANDIMNSPLPPNLTTEEVAAYQMKLNEVATPLLKNAAKYFQANLNQAKKLKLQNQWIEKSQTHFANLTNKGVKIE